MRNARAREALDTPQTLSVAVLGEAPGALELCARLGVRATADAIEALRGERSAGIVLFGTRSSETASLVDAIPPEERPAVIAIGPYTDAVPMADEWITSSTDPDASFRWNLALERARTRRQISRRAFIDPLTRLPNRRAALRAFLREASRAHRHQTAMSLVLIDLDEFKQVNDREGHPAGDRLLRSVGIQLARATRQDELCARIGGDEFALVIADGLRAAQFAATRALRAIRRANIDATTAVGELLPGERLRDLYRRTDDELRKRKTMRRASKSASNGLL